MGLGSLSYIHKIDSLTSFIFHFDNFIHGHPNP